MKRTLFKLILASLCLLTAFTSCDKSESGADGDNAIYYWRTTFTLSKNEKEFLKKHNINKLYVRFFDVEPTGYYGDGHYAKPSATIQFKTKVPDGIEIVPTVYITNDAMRAMRNKESEYAEKIYKRVNAICRNAGYTFKEIQLDCDWTNNTREPFFNLCRSLSLHLKEGQTLSSTIRLHQLTQDPPPVSKGVLMVYNTGNLMEMTTDNSIFSKKDIKPYLSHDRLEKYNLPLDVAYPAYGWSVVFKPVESRYRFHHISRQTDFSDFTTLVKTGKNFYKAISYTNLDPNNYDDNAYEGFIVRVEQPSANEVLEVKELIERQLQNKPHNNILYHLDEKLLSHYTNNEIKRIYKKD